MNKDIGEVIYPTLRVDWEAGVPRIPLFIIGKLRKLDLATYHFSLEPGFDMTDHRLEHLEKEMGSLSPGH